MVHQTGAWEIEYFDEDLDSLVPVRAEIDQVADELSGDQMLPSICQTLILIGI